ncbi:hypothetical protein RFI_23400 [Reticulomyxa filosa]|uniref:Choline transporter-like protein n=1 Tax=Reticulomyxa filosa TaxID=46433 RepID=X6MIY7_RETFI|nr:hypothetical protein RFI_23400 [Reticulomyxa filosa]|eukprot:ETO13968.1 hypothetical protein RFI_23400 [Reticulomyxa filosa]
MNNNITNKYTITNNTILIKRCYGSLIVAIIQTARALVRNAQNQHRGNAFVLCILQCLLACLESLIRFFNNYAYAQVAIYGTCLVLYLPFLCVFSILAHMHFFFLRCSFCEVFQTSWNLLTNKGLDAWINDDLTGFALSCGALVGALVTALVGYILSTAFTSIHSDMRVGYLLAGFVIGYFLCATVMMVVRSAVIAVFVCWAEDPASMAHNRPNEFHLISEQWTKLYGPRH